MIVCELILFMIDIYIVCWLWWYVLMCCLFFFFGRIYSSICVCVCVCPSFVMLLILVGLSPYTHSNYLHLAWKCMPCAIVSIWGGCLHVNLAHSLTHKQWYIYWKHPFVHRKHNKFDVEIKSLKLVMFASWIVRKTHKSTSFSQKRKKERERKAWHVVTWRYHSSCTLISFTSHLLYTQTYIGCVQHWHGQLISLEMENMREKTRNENIR